MSRLNVAVWGLGNHAKNRILPTLADINEINLLGVCSRSKTSVADISEQWGCYGWCNPEEMLKCPTLDIIYIATPIGLHFSMAEQALKAGKHVWCEKPLTCDYRETQTLVALAKKNSKVLTESFMYLHHPQFKRVKQFVDQSHEVNFARKKKTQRNFPRARTYPVQGLPCAVWNSLKSSSVVHVS